MTKYQSFPSSKKNTAALRRATRVAPRHSTNSIVSEITPQKLVAEVGVLYVFAIKRVRDHHHAEDLVQKCLTTAWDKRLSYEGRSSLRTWLVGILRFKILDHFRSIRRVPTNQADEIIDACGSEEMAAGYNPRRGEGSPLEATCRSEVFGIILECLNQLPDRLRIIFTMREIEGLAVSEIATAVGTTPGSTAVMLTRARARMRKSLRRLDIHP